MLLYSWSSHETVWVTINPFIETFLMCYNRNVRILSHDHQNTFTIEVYKHSRYLLLQYMKCPDIEYQKIPSYYYFCFIYFIWNSLYKLGMKYLEYLKIAYFNLTWITKAWAIYVSRGTYPLDRLCRILRAHLLLFEQKKSSSWGVKVYGVYPISKVQYLYCC